MGRIEPRDHARQKAHRGEAEETDEAGKFQRE
jgi:hypothetical protein